MLAIIFEIEGKEVDIRYLEKSKNVSIMELRLTDILQNHQ